MHVDYLIIGQGISGTWLSYYLKKNNSSFLVIDDNDPGAASRLSAGVINPVTGRRHVEVWLADQVLPFAWDAYKQIGKELNIEAISETSVIDFFPTPQMRHSFLQRVEENTDYVFEYAAAETFKSFIDFDFGAGEIKPVFLAHLETLLPAWRKELSSARSLLEEKFNIDDLKNENGKIKYRDFTASFIIFCDGNAGTTNKFFQLLPFALNKGEVLIVEIKDLPRDHIYKKGMMMVPLSSPGLWWVGSDYKWKFDNDLPTEQFRQQTELMLKNWLKVPFKIVDHLAGIRPATLERRPFVGMHPNYPNIGILNGMGTKGCSLAPFFAKQLFNHLVHNAPILPEVNVNRFKKILSK